ncbi:MAG: conjugal transfer protein TraG, partial [Ferruginibacter sp.]|nr:conjugal transfer protein TraG [Ferruginibacter sp.]
SRIAALSSGEFVGLVADNPDEKIKLKMFNAEIINDSEKLNVEIAAYKDIPIVKKVTQQEVLDNYYHVKFEIKQLIKNEIARLKEEKENRIFNN